MTQNPLPRWESIQIHVTAYESYCAQAQKSHAIESRYSRSFFQIFLEIKKRNPKVQEIILEGIRLISSEEFVALDIRVPCREDGYCYPAQEEVSRLFSEAGIAHFHSREKF